MPDVEWISKGAERVIKDFEKVASATEKQAIAVKGTTKANEELGRIAGKAIKDTETAWQRYERQMINAKRALDDNKISQQQYNRESVRATVEMAKSTDAVDKNTAAHNRSAAGMRQKIRLQEAFRLETLRGVSHIQQETASIGAQTVQLGNYATKVGQVASSWSQLLGMAGKLAPFLGGAAIMGAMNQDSAASSAAGQKAIDASAAAGRLMELAGGSRKKRDQLLGASRASYLEGGFTDENQSHALTFELESGGMLKERAFFSKVQQGGWNSAELAKSIGTYRAGFRGGDAVGSSEQIMSKAMAASALAPGAGMEDILRGATSASSNAKQIGISDEENMAFIGLLAETTGSGEQAGTLADSYYRSMIGGGYVDKGGKGLVGLLGDVKGKGLLKSELQKSLGRQEASAAFSMASDLSLVQNRIANIQSAGAGGKAAATVETAIGIPSRTTAISVNAHNAAGQVAEEAEGLRTERVRASNDRQRSQRRNEMPGIISGPANAMSYGFDAVWPDALQDPGTGNPNAKGEMDQMLDIMENNKRAREQSMQSAAPSEAGNDQSVRLLERIANGVEQLNTVSGGRKGKAPTPMGKPE